MPSSLPLLVLGLSTASLLAQTARPAQPEDFGAVTGRVICSDTQHPARIAEVRLVPVAVSPAPEGKPGGGPEFGGTGGSVLPVETDMSGAFTVRNVRPGQYYVRVDYKGYLNPLLGFTRDELARPTAAQQQRIESDLQVVSVAPHATTQLDVTLVRGAAISGDVTYDDGSPAIGIQVLLLRKDAKGSFTRTFQTSSQLALTDDHGRFRKDSLPADEYVVKANLTMSDHTMMSLPMPNVAGGMMQVAMTQSRFDLPVYSGSALRRRDAVVVKAEAGHEVTDADITVPLAKLHSLSGTLLAGDGHAINSGVVALLHSDDREEAGKVKVDREDTEFHFPYVAEDDYLLSVPEAKDVMQVEVENARGVTPRTHLEDKTVRAFGPAEQPLKVQTDMTGIIVNVPDKKADKAETPTGAGGTRPVH